MTCRPQTLNLLPQHCTLKTEYDSKTSPCSSHYEQVKGAWSSSIATTARENNGTLVRLGLKPRDDAPTSMGRGWNACVPLTRGLGIDSIYNSVRKEVYEMNCTQKQQLVCFPKVRVYKPWFRHFNDHKDFRNEGTVHLFSLMALFSYANFRSNERVINDDRYRRKHKRHVIRSLSLTQKGFDYVAQSDPEAVAMIYSRINCSERVYPSKVDKILRLHAIAVGTVMAHAADAEILISQKPSLMSPAKRTSNTITPDPTQCYYYASHELRVAIEEYSPESVSKSSRTIGIVVKGKHCYFLYFTGSTRMYWMKNSEENYAAAVKSLLLARGFGVTTIHQVVIGSTMSVAQRLCHSAKPFGNKYFVVSTFFAQCLFLTNNPDGDSLMKIILNPDMALELNQAILAPYHPPRTPNREYDAIDVQHDKPVILNYQCDLLKLSDIRPIPEGFRGSPIMLCFDYQTQTVQGIVGPAIEVRPVESMNNHGKKKTENNP